MKSILLAVRLLGAVSAGILSVVLVLPTGDAVARQSRSGWQIEAAASLHVGRSLPNRAGRPAPGQIIPLPLHTYMSLWANTIPTSSGRER